MVEEHSPGAECGQVGEGPRRRGVARLNPRVSSSCLSSRAGCWIGQPGSPVPLGPQLMALGAGGGAFLVNA